MKKRKLRVLSFVLLSTSLMVGVSSTVNASEDEASTENSMVVKITEISTELQDSTKNTDTSSDATSGSNTNQETNDSATNSTTTSDKVTNDATTSKEETITSQGPAEVTNSKEVQEAIKDAKEHLNELVEGNLLTQEQVTKFLPVLDSAKTLDEVFELMNDFLEKNLSVEGLAFYNAYYDAIDKIEGLLEKGLLTEKEADDFLDRLEKCTNIDEIQKLLAEIDEKIKLGSPANSTVQSSTSTSSSTSSSSVTKPSGTAKTLPKTGEENVPLVGFFGIFLASLSAVAVFFKLK